ncbi:YbaB/EbfC family nucleoid-associated protein [Gordonia sp. (in: high G+C Gram-positive bacteria)]|uniref:YbaB/EbfC family nucleoid-associated protein n=1 Tax=Gordonia sp. (in: high G+C Gram-positive bacteria) TaxID=84139 RepID=UPI003C76128B
MNSEMDAVADRAQRQLGALEDVHAKLTALRAEGTGDQGRVRVLVNGNGSLVDLELGPGAGGGKGSRLADEIVGAAIRAATDVFTRRAEIMQDFCDDFAALTEPAAISER